MADLNAKTIVVVGASGVLGAEIADQLAAAGARIIGTASYAQTTLAIPASAGERHVCDLNDAASVREFVDGLHARRLPIDGIVMAAGLVAFGPARETPEGVLETLLRVNALGPINLINSLAPLMAGRDGAFVVTISGKIAEVPTAGIAAYSASKIALHGWVSAASREFRREGIRLMDARPGHTETGLASRAIWGVAPVFAAGLSLAHVASRIVQGIVDDEKDLPSSAFE